MEFQHFLITRFNLKNLPFDTDKSREEWTNWTEDRIPIFLNYCMPSVLNQSNQNFTWLIFIDQSTPDHLLQQLPLNSQDQNVKWCLVRRCENFGQEMLKWVKDEIDSNTKWIISTNLDNDDVLHKDAIEIVQSNFVPMQDHLIYMSNGYTYHTFSRKLSHYYYPQSPFLSLIESADMEMKGLFYRPHSHWLTCELKFLPEMKNRIKHRRNNEATYILDGPLWAQIIHGNNVTNNFYRGLPVLKEKTLAAFGIGANSMRMDLTSIFKYRNYVYWKRYLFCSILKWLN